MKLLCGILSAALFLACFSMPALADDAPEASARAGILVEAESGGALWEKNADAPMLIASTTKIMTALVVLERCDPDVSVEIEPEWTGIEGSSMYLKAGQRFTVRELLYGMMLASGNDAAVALACITAGSVEAFASLMNERAAQLGCENTHFENPHGLDGDSHHASAADLALITREALRNETFREIVSCEAKTIGGATYRNHNRLLRECEGVFGVKTGYTEAAGRSLVTCCERGGVTLLCVTIGDPDDWNDHTNLYDWGFGECVREEVVSDGRRWSVPVVGGEAETVLVRPEESLYVTRLPGEAMTTVIRLPAFVHAGVTAGESIGELLIYKDGEAAGSVALVCAQDVAPYDEPERTAAELLSELFGFGERKIYTLS